MVNDSNNNSRGGLYGETDLRGFDDDGFSISDENNGETAESGGKNYKPIGGFFDDDTQLHQKVVNRHGSADGERRTSDGKKIISREEFERRLEEKRKTGKKRRIIFFSSVICFAVLVVLLIVWGTGGFSSLLKKAGANVQLKYTAYISEVQYSGSSDARVTYADGCLFVVDGALITCHNMSGTFLWDYNFEDAVSPAFIPYENCVLAYGSNFICAFGKSGVIWEKRIDGTVDGVFLNESAGMSAVVYKNDLYKSAVKVLSVAKGEPKEIFTKNYASQYIISAALSDDGKSLALSGVSADDGAVKGIISLINTADGESYYAKYIEETVVPYVRFIDNESLAAAGPDELLCIKNEKKVKDPSSPDDVISVSKGDGASKLLCVGISGAGMCAAVFGSGDSSSTAVICNSSGEAVKSVSFENSVKSMDSSDDCFAMVTDTELVLVDTGGTVVGRCSDFTGIAEARIIDKNHVLVTHGNGVAVVEFR